MRAIGAIIAILIFIGLVSSSCSDSEGACAKWEELDAKALSEGAYFKYEHQIDMARRECIANGGVD